MAADLISDPHEFGRWTCTSNWLDGSHNGIQPWRAAAEDVADVRRADVLIVDMRRPSTRGGTWVEFGIALERQMPIVVIAKPGQDSYPHLQAVDVVTTTAAAVAWMERATKVL